MDRIFEFYIIHNNYAIFRKSGVYERSFKNIFAVIRIAYYYATICGIIGKYIRFYYKWII